ncbi:MAG TPA: penicillin-binding protein 2 [Verrucomicrobiae bacterium]
MFVIDQARRSDPRLRFLGLLVCAGFLVLLSGLWYVQIVSFRKHENSMKVQSFRTVRIPAARGRILDRSGNVLADNQPRYNVKLYLEDIRAQFTHEYTNSLKKQFVAKNGRTPKQSERWELERSARYNVVSNIVWQVSSAVSPVPMILNSNLFERAYREQRAIPLSLVTDLTQQQIALFLEKASNLPGVQLEVEPYRFYPHGSLAAHVLGFTRKDQKIEDFDDNEIRFNYPIAVDDGVTGVEQGFNDDLLGKEGAKAILVNNIGYRESEETWIEPSPGKNVVLTLDMEIQKSAERALAMAGPDTRGAVVVMNVRNGDILALASAPTYDLNMFVRWRDYSKAEQDRMEDPVLRPQYNRALQGFYHPGSIFKIIVGLAAFEAGVTDLNYAVPNPGYFMVGKRQIDDNNAPKGGNYAFIEAFKYSANTYFLDVGLKAGVDRIVEMGRRFNLGEKTGIVQPELEKAGYFPEVGQRSKREGGRWMEGDTANLCIGQGEIMVTPLQMALMTSAIANGGTLVRPRLVMQLEDQGQNSLPEVMPHQPKERDINVNPQHLAWVRRAMLEDVEDQKAGTGKAAYVPGMGISGKTGTAQIRTPKGIDHVVWFVSFAPYENPKYAVVVMVEGHRISGGGVAAPKAKEIYKTIQQLEQDRLKHIAVH